MIQLTTLMWWMAVFFGIIGFLRGWKKELVATAGIVLALFAVFQFDGILRGTFFLSLPQSQVFLVQTAFLMGVVFFVYQAKDIGGAHIRKENDWQAGLLGLFMGVVNGYLVAGSLWYFLDINEYPFEQLVVAPAAGTASAQSYNIIPIVLIGGGASGTGDIFALGVLILLFFALVVA